MTYPNSLALKSLESYINLASIQVNLYKQIFHCVLNLYSLIIYYILPSPLLIKLIFLLKKQQNKRNIQSCFIEHNVIAQKLASMKYLYFSTYCQDEFFLHTKFFQANYFFSYTYLLRIILHDYQIAYKEHQNLYSSYHFLQ